MATRNNTRSSISACSETARYYHRVFAAA